MTELSNKKIVVLSGGVGAAKLLRGLVTVVLPESVTAIVNTGDDLSLHGLHISPDLDTIIYTLGNEINPDTGEEEPAIYTHRQFEKKFFSKRTNHSFCKAFMENALSDPISGEIGKTIVICVSQAHASKITQILNITIMQNQIFFITSYISRF